ncbi:MAG: DUF6178 family protein [Candidatus Theseobacter exili]|nr:DUF6178 family protein [Candidatus Theseobacter exili]
MNTNNFDSLAIQKQKQILKKSAYDQKADLILHSRDPEQLVRQMSGEELLLILIEGRNDRLKDLIIYANNEQLQFLCDMQCWEHERIEKDRFLGWLDDLIEADPDKLAEWLSITDVEMLIAAYANVVRVIKAPPADEAVPEEFLDNDDQFFTLDRFYYVSAEQHQLDTIKRSIEMLFSSSPSLYMNLMEGIMSALHDEMEETAYQQRQNRLSASGFSETEEAHRIYRVLSQEEWESVPVKETDSEEPYFQEETESINPNFLSLWEGDRLFLDDALALLSKEPESFHETVRMELASLTNKIIATEGISFNNSRKLKDQAERVRRYINIGLEERSQSDVLYAADLLKTRWLEDIFRWGHSLLVTLRKKAERVFKSNNAGLESEQVFSLLDKPYCYFFRGMVKKHPQIFDPSVTSNTYHLRDPRHYRELMMAHQLLVEIEAAFRVFKIAPFDKWQDKTREKLMNLPPSEISIGQIVMTVLARTFLGLSSEVTPLSSIELAKFFTDGFHSGPPRRLRDEIKLHLQDWDGIDVETMEYLSNAISLHESELAEIDPLTHNDPRFIQGILVYL